ncbi:acyl--CoA ligase [Priestia flexa]|uniref:acyl-CoA synthetase MbcS n=1 Tax=Priestia flexa TaxID=86664 RepID=UPI000C2490B0|nr:acyl--CoA ligase [Priestia flexa]MEC0667336.1 acyl--CoA ligase [Priestia flexa]MED3822995.1 acyl--CoA ligase [Priestia flexa]
MIRLEELIPKERYNLTEEFEKHASDHLAIKWQDADGHREEITYNNLLKRANKAANSLTELGLTKGDHVLVIIPRLIDSYVMYLACLKAGIVIIPSSEMLRAKDIQYRLHHAQAKAIISYSPFCQEVDQVTDLPSSLKHKIVLGDAVNSWTSLEPLMDAASDQFEAADTHRDDTAFLPYTSGTTGNPKGVVHTHGWAYAHLRLAAREWLDIKKGDIVWATAGPGWQKWVWSPFLSVLGQGATGIVYNGRFEPEKYLAILQDEQVNVLCCTPTEYRFMAKSANLDSFDLSHIHSAVSAGEPLNEEVMSVFKQHFGIQVRDGYGQTENTLLIGTLKNVDVKVGSMGKPMLEEFIEIVDEDGNPCAPGEIGDIAVRKDLPSLFKHYYKDEDRTKKAFCGNYYLTGDRASKDADNYYWFQGRSDDIIISSGYTIGPFEVEDALIKHSAVKECAVVASPDPDRGNVVKAFVVLTDPTLTADESLVKDLQNHVKQLTAPYKYPRLIEFVSDLPKTNSGKIRRVELRAREQQVTQ